MAFYRTKTAAIIARSRLYPRFYDGRYQVLVGIRRCFEQLIAQYHADLVGATLVDLGCGAMPYRSLFAPHLRRYLGADLPDNAEADLHIPPAGQLPLADGSVDLVLSSQALEHVIDPVAYLAEARRILRPGGLLMLSTHGHWIYHPYPTDYWRWTGSGLQKIVREAGFVVEQIEGVLGTTGAALQIVQETWNPRVPPRLRPLFSLVTQSLIGWGDRLHTPAERQADACVFVIVGRRPLDQ
jgi:SAM-dependent methyltransferase